MGAPGCRPEPILRPAGAVVPAVGRPDLTLRLDQAAVDQC